MGAAGTAGGLSDVLTPTASLHDGGSRYPRCVVKQLLVVVLVLVLVILLTGIPMGMPVADCTDCDLGVLAAGVCVFAVLAAAVALVAAQVGAELRPRRFTFLTRLTADGLERPPRLA